MNLQNFSFSTDTETLSAFRMIADNGDIPTCLLLHGAGMSDKERLIPLAGEFAKLGISSIGFDYSGAGQSTHNTPISIKKRAYEASTALEFLDTNKPSIICGFSMSGQIVMNLIETYTNISHIILFAPGLYNIGALDVPFGEDFTTIIRQPESWKENNSKEKLEKFTGKLLVVIGSLDNVIPKDIPKIIAENACNAKSRDIHIIEGAPHMLAGWTQENIQNAEYTGQLLRKFMEINP